MLRNVKGEISPRVEICICLTLIIRRKQTNHFPLLIVSPFQDGQDEPSLACLDLEAVHVNLWPRGRAHGPQQIESK